MTSATAAATGLQRIGFVRAALRAAEMREQDDLAALVRDLLDRRRDALDARRVGDAAVLGRNVEVDAQQHALAGDVGVVEGAERLGHGQRLTSVRTRSSDARSGVRSRVGRPRRTLDPRFREGDVQPQISFAIATAVSAMRFEKPHSLSYQESTRTKLPSITLVWSRWKIDERSSWLKSIETFGSSV